MNNNQLKELIKNKYENGEGLTKLCKKYELSINTVNSWKKREGWKKKEGCTPPKKNKKNAPKDKTGAIKKELEIHRDYLEGMSKEDIMRKYALAERTYYEKTKNSREIRLKKTEKYLDDIIDEVYPDLKGILKNIEITKKNLLIKTIKETAVSKLDIKKIEEYKKTYDYIQQMQSNLIQTGKMLSNFDLLNVDKQLTEEDILREKLEIEKLKQNITQEKEQVVILNDMEVDDE